MGYLDPGAGAAREAKQADAVDDLEQEISETPTTEEVQAISDKVDELLAALRDAGVIAAS